MIKFFSPLKLFTGTGALLITKNATSNDSHVCQEPSEQFVLVSSGSSTRDDSIVDSQSVVLKKKSFNTESILSKEKCSIDSFADSHSKRDNFMTELESTIAIVSRRSKLKDLVLSSEVPAKDMDRAWEKVLDGVRNLLSDQERVDAIMNEMLKSESNKIQEELMSLASDSGTETSVSDIETVTESSMTSKNFLPISQQHQWDDLARDHPCRLCKELLAAPVITNCSHSFCGACLNDHIESISSIDIDVVHSCPCCRYPILTPIYERVLDENIAKKVGTLSRCCMSVRWQERRDKYLKDKQKKAKNFDRITTEAIQIAIPIVALLVITIFIMA
jgi:Zinc finger, C3HC4 type (RING finger)